MDGPWLDLIWGCRAHMVSWYMHLRPPGNATFYVCTNMVGLISTVIPVCSFSCLYRICTFWCKAKSFLITVSLQCVMCPLWKLNLTHIVISVYSVPIQCISLLMLAPSANACPLYTHTLCYSPSNELSYACYSIPVSSFYLHTHMCNIRKVSKTGWKVRLCVYVCVWEGLAIILPIATAPTLFPVMVLGDYFFWE